MSVINAIPALLAAGGDYQISRSVRLRSSASAYFNRTFGAGGSQTTWTLSLWYKRGALGQSSYPDIFSTNSASPNQNNFRWNADDTLVFYVQSSATTLAYLQTTQVFRDPSAWYHIVLVVDTTNATSTDRLRLYVNGQRITSFSTAIYPSQNQTLPSYNGATAHYLGSSNTTAGFNDCYMTEINFIGGQALTPSYFGETDTITGVWKPKKYTGTYGTNGFYLNFSDNSNNTAATIGKDYSGNGNNWTPNNVSVTAGVTYDSMLDTPTPYADGGNGRGNYAVINPTMTPQFAQTYSEGNLKCTGGYAYVNAQSTIGASSGKWYAEAVFTAKTSATLSVGINNKAVSNYIGNSGETGSVGYWTNATKTINGSSTAYGATYTTNDVIGVAMDIDGGTVTFYKNGTSQGSISYTFSGEYGFLTSGGGAFASGDTVVWNFGQRPFSYTPPTGYNALNTQNLPAGSITTSGSFTGNASADGPSVYLNGVPTAMTINGNAVTFATHVDKTAYGFKLRTSSSSYNASGSNSYSITTTGAKFKYANAQVNP